MTTPSERIAAAREAIEEYEAESFDQRMRGLPTTYSKASNAMWIARKDFIAAVDERDEAVALLERAFGFSKEDDRTLYQLTEWAVERISELEIQLEESNKLITEIIQNKARELRGESKRSYI